MKKFLILLSLLFCGVAIAETLNVTWYNTDNTVYDTTTCTVGGTLTLPTTPTRYGYTFLGWVSYTPIEYLKSTGTQYIDTGVYPNGLIRMKAKIQTLRNNGTNSAFSGVVHQGFTGVWQIVYPYNGINFNASQQDISFSQDYVGVQDFDIDQVNKTITCNGVTKNMTKTPIAVQPGHSNIPLGRYQNEINPSQNYWYGKIYFVKLYDNDVLVRDFIPVLDPDGVACLYDKVSHTFFYNAGTGDFIAGPAL